MSLFHKVRQTYLRIDARSLGLFRIVMAIALIGDWCERWPLIRSFYSNEGALPNHAHLYHVLKQDPPERVWSVFHAFSTPGEARVGFLLALLVYLLFLIGFHTRVFHIVSIFILVSFVGRNIFIETPATSLALPLLIATAFLPCGSRFSIDSLRNSFNRKKEKDATDLNDQTPSSEEAIDAERSPGWSPTSLAALAVLLHLTIIYIAITRQQVGPKWQSGTALHYALWVERTVSDVGILVRGAPSALLSAWSFVLRYAPFAIPVLLFIPLPRLVRPGAFWLMLVYGLSYTLLFQFGLWGTTLTAAAFLAISTDTWQSYQSNTKKGRSLTVIYDADCGICLWIARLLARLDLRGHLTFQGNNLLDTPPRSPGAPYRSTADESGGRVLYRRGKSGIETSPLPEKITDELASNTVIAVDEKGEVYTESRAVAKVLRSLPLGFLLFIPLVIPGTAGIWNALYQKVAQKRMNISESVGLGACGVPQKTSNDPAGPSTHQVAPAVRMKRALTGLVREVGSVAFLLAVLAQTGKANPWPAALSIPQYRVFAALTGWSRSACNFSLLAPEPPSEDGVFIVDAQTRGGLSVDTLTGKPPVVDKPHFRMGQYWSAYTDRIRKRDMPAETEKLLRDYLAQKGGPNWAIEPAENQIAGLDAYWIVYKLPPPGSNTPEITGRDKIFSFSRGGKGDMKLPIIKPSLIR
ncbi:MAG: DUF393 domain-containing protein [Polyangiaceae bacterium]|nr:DUF393 domain-containing protein [Polyangiaceae bacterium]